MSLTKKVYLTISGYDIKLSDNLTFYQKDQLKLIFYINEYGIDYENNATTRALMPVNPLNAILFIENPEGVDSVSSAKIEDNAVTFYLSSEHTQYIGVSRMQLRLFDQDGCAITLPHFTFEIRENIYGSGDVRFQNVVMVDQTGTVILTEDNDMLDVGDILTIGPEVPYPQVTKTIKELPVKHGLDGTEKLIVEDNEATKQAPLTTIVDEIKQNSQEKIRKIESELAQTNAQLSHITNYITYEMFGAKGDGVTDDGLAIKAAHEYANKNNLKVIATGKTYYIQNEVVVEIKTNTDFNNATFIIDDTLDGINRKLPVFNVTSKYDKISVNTNGIHIDKSTTQIPLLSGFGDCLVEVLNDDKRQYIRKGENATAGESQCDYFNIDNDGNVMNDIIWDFGKITQINLYPIDDDFLVINNGKFITKTNNKHQEYNYFERGFLINRSNVIIDNINHDLIDEVSGAPYYGFIHAVRCSNLYIKNCLLQSHITYRSPENVRMGTYDIRIERSTNIRLDNIIDKSFRSTRWGILSSFYTKDVYVEKCKLGRYDAHTGVHNLTIRDCVFGWQAISLVGSGLCLVENVTIFNAQYIIYLRPDYGSNWNGDMILKNVKLMTQEMSFTPKIIHFENDGTHDFGYECCYPKRLVMEDIYIDDTNVLKAGGSYENMFITFNIEDYTGVIDDSYLYPYKFSESIECKNLKTESGRGFKVFPSSTYNLYGNSEFEFKELGVTDAKNKHLEIKANLNIILDNVELSDYENDPTMIPCNIFGYPTSIDAKSDGFLDNPHRVLPNITIKNSGDVSVYTKDHPIVLEIDNCTVKNLVMVDKSPRSIGRAVNCTFKPDLLVPGVAVRANWGSFKFLHCYFDEVRISGSVVSDVTSITTAYEFLNLFKLINNQYVHARLIMCNCGIFNFRFNDLNDKLVDCRFRFGNHHFEYYLPSSGTFANKPDPAYVTIPVGFCYYVTSTKRYILWNGSKWIYLKDETEV